jgi:hypothetical protein
MAPDVTVGSSWAIPDNPRDTRTVRVEATKDDKLVYCRVFGWNDLEQIRWRIEVTTADNCS